MKNIFILRPTCIGSSQGFIIPKRIRRLNKKQYVIILFDVEDVNRWDQQLN